MSSRVRGTKRQSCSASKRPEAFMDLRSLRKEIKAVCDGVYPV